MKDDQEFNIRFVGLVKAHPCLYDNTREDYHLTHIQERAWTAISITIGDGATNAQCKSRWKNLRGSYTKHIKHYGSGAATKRPYYLADYISFVLPFTKQRQSKANIVPTTSKQPPATYDEADFTDDLETQDLNCENEEDSRQDVNHENPEVKHEEVDWIATQEDSSAYNQQDIFEGSNPATGYDKTNAKFGIEKRVMQKTSAPLSEINKKSKRNKIKQRKVTVDDVNKTIFEYFEKEKRVPRKMPDICTTDDADMHFLLSLLPDFKKMKDSQKRRFKVGILQLAGQILDETSCGITAPSSSGASTIN